MKIVATIEARMTSSRLPGKVLMEAVNKPMLHHLVTRLRAVPSIDVIVLAITTNSTDDILVSFAESEGIAYFRGSEDNVMERVIGAADSVNADVVVEITGDCPIIDYEVIDQAIRMFLVHDADYVSNVDVRSYPDGMDVQVFRLDTLKRSASMTTDSLEQEHVTLHIRKHPELFTKLHLVAPPEIRWPELRLTLDEMADYELLKRVIEYFGQDYPLFTCLDIVRLLRNNIDWVDINKAVQSKGDT